MTNAWVPDLRLNEKSRRVPDPVAAGGFQHPWILPDGSLVTDFQLWAAAWIWAGYGYNIEAGLASTPITFAGAYDADAPDLFVHIPLGYAVVPLSIQVTYEAVGTESTMEIMALASPEGDSSATGTAATVSNMRVGAANSHGLTATGAIDAAGITDPNVTGAFTFVRRQRPLTDTVATGENDRNELNWKFAAMVDFFPPIILGTPAGTLGSAAAGGSMAVYAASQAGTGFILSQVLVFPPTIAEILFGA